MNKQECWDDILIRSFLKGYIPMWLCIQQLEAHGHPTNENLDDYFKGMLRAPLCGRHITWQTSRSFIGGSMPWLNNFLWDHPDIDLTLFIAKVSASKYNHEVKSKAVREEINYRRKEERHLKQLRFTKDIDGNHDWATVKSVRSAK